MTSVPITFTYQGCEYSGNLSQVQGAGSTKYYQTLVVDQTGYTTAEGAGITNKLSVAELMSALELKIKKVC